jgi:hypothetical protein
MMAAMHDSPSEKVTLRREVQPPHRQPTGLGVMLIASAAMFFAVAGSAFVVRARMAGHCCDRAHPSPHAQAQVRPMPPPLPAPMIGGAGEVPCGEAVYRTGADGTVLVDFRLCPPGETGGDQQAGGFAPAVPILVTDR